MTKQQILDMLRKHETYVNDCQNPEKWEAYKSYKSARQAWRQVKGDD